MKEAMTIDEIRQVRHEAEQQILGVLKEFKKCTGLSIVGCDVGHRITGECGGGGAAVVAGTDMQPLPRSAL